MEKQEVWDSIADKVDKTRDALNMSIDSGIKETVIALQALGFSTVQSCEGHDGRGLPYPWIDIYCGDDADLIHYNADVKMAEYLEDFYLNRTPLKWARLAFDHFKDSFRLQSFIGRSAKKLKQTNPTEYQILRKNCSDEMSEFTNFLKEKFWNK